MSYPVEQKLREALRGFKLSFAFSLLGTLIEGLALLVSYNIILLADLSHWMIDTVLEALFVLSIWHASKTYRRFPLGVLILESLLVTITALLMLVIYGYMFVSYFINFTGANTSGNYHVALSSVTIAGGLLTLLVAYIQRKNYERLRLSVLKVDYKHAVIDTLAAAVATSGIVVVSLTNNPGYEALFLSLLTLFVLHSVLEVLGDTFRTITGKNFEPELRLKIYKKLESSLEKVNVKSVEARKIGSFYIVSVSIETYPHMTIKEAYRLRSKVIKLVREEDEMIYHVDVFIKPTAKDRRFGTK